jgi:hypothetical protein
MKSRRKRKLERRDGQMGEWEKVWEELYGFLQAFFISKETPAAERDRRKRHSSSTQE